VPPAEHPAVNPKPASPGFRPRHVSLIGFPDVVVSTLFGIFDAMNAFSLMQLSPGSPAPFRVEIIGERSGRMPTASGLSVDLSRSIDDIDVSDIVIVPSVALLGRPWVKGRYPRLVEWLTRMHQRGATLCSACSGIFLLAETGLFEGKAATVHFSYSQHFAATFPGVPIHPERVVVISGSRDELVSSGAATSWHDMILHLIARHAGPTAAQEVARMFALQWHQDGLTPYIVFEGKRDHGDAEIAGVQQWLSGNFAVANPVEEMIQRSKLAERTFKRRFLKATGLTPIQYVQRLRIEDAKRRLERTTAPVEEIGWRVGYEDGAFFRRLFRRTTGLAPGAYRRRFCIPSFALPPGPPSRR
jgi:transcriptional regulator GlxA family with amidase domain